ncbi:hypothetical protein Ocin01_09770 [Orchesella cincta]|uniref:F-box domain-containing protein n=1 Tax=Orchesella cincta TaxID=48709 RepID=A0A1D2MUY1_ORCCI|nr:hypothetical protein Ocin01_09770 [Orchesella cincta]
MRLRSAKQTEATNTPWILQLPSELLDPIINFLPLNTILSLRLTCSRLYINVEKFYRHFRMNLCADQLSPDQLDFISRINLQKITFNRVAKPLNESFTDEPCLYSKKMKHRKQKYNPFYSGPSQYFEVGRIQVRSLQAAKSSSPGSNNNYTGRRDLQNYLLGIGSEDIFDHV